MCGRLVICLQTNFVKFTRFLLMWILKRAIKYPVEKTANKDCVQQNYQYIFLTKRYFGRLNFQENINTFLNQNFKIEEIWEIKKQMFLRLFLLIILKLFNPRNNLVPRIVFAQNREFGKGFFFSKRFWLPVIQCFKILLIPLNSEIRIIKI